MWQGYTQYCKLSNLVQNDIYRIMNSYECTRSENIVAILVSTGVVRGFTRLMFDRRHHPELPPGK